MNATSTSVGQGMVHSSAQGVCDTSPGQIIFLSFLTSVRAKAPKGHDVGAQVGSSQGYVWGSTVVPILGLGSRWARTDRSPDECPSMSQAPRTPTLPQE